MTIYSAAPPARTFQQDKPTLLVAWWCTLFSAAIILFRVAGRYVRTERLFREDRLAFTCLIPLFLRMAFVHAVLLFGTNNVEVDGLSELSIQNRIIGSRLVLVSRITYAATLWMLKFTITEFLKRLTLQIWTHSYEVTLRCIRWFLLLSFIAIVLSDLLECRSFTHYWQVTPDPGGHCRQAYAQLLTAATCNVLTDLLLVIFPIPIILHSSMPLSRKFQLIGLFGLSTIPIAVTFYQIPEIINKEGRQQTRSLWASVEILAATAVANALVLGSFVRDRGIKKQKWKVGSFSESLERTISLRGTVARAWGSDEDLVRDLGLGVDRELQHNRNISTVPRPAPMATSGDLTRALSTINSNKSLPSNHRSWDFATDRNPYAKSGENYEARDTSSEDYDLLKVNKHNHDDGEDPDLSSMITPRKISFFDVGGLLGTEGSSYSHRASETYTDTTISSTLSNLTPNPFLQRQQSGQSLAFAHPTPLSPTPQRHSSNTGSSPSETIRRGSAALLHDLGGLLTPLNASVSHIPHAHPRSNNDNGTGLPLSQTQAAPSHQTHRPSIVSSHSAMIPHSNPRPTPTVDWIQRPFSFTPAVRSHSSNPSGPFASNAIQMKPIRSERSAFENENFQDIGGLLKK